MKNRQGTLGEFTWLVVEGYSVTWLDVGDSVTWLDVGGDSVIIDLFRSHEYVPRLHIDPRQLLRVFVKHDKGEPVEYKRQV